MPIFDATATLVGASPTCADCEGFSFRQVEPGVWYPCPACLGSGLADVRGTLNPSVCVRNARLDERRTSGERIGATNREKGRAA
jgi:hypothetical protein